MLKVPTLPTLSWGELVQEAHRNDDHGPRFLFVAKLASFSSVVMRNASAEGVREKLLRF